MKSYHNFVSFSFQNSEGLEQNLSYVSFCFDFWGALQANLQNEWSESGMNDFLQSGFYVVSDTQTPHWIMRIKMSTLKQAPFRLEPSGC